MCPPSDLPFNSGFVSNVEKYSKLIPQTPLSLAAYHHASTALHPVILTHSLRVYSYAGTVAALTNSIYHTDPAKHDLLFIAGLFHDIGTAEPYNGPYRFEVDGGDAAVKFLAENSPETTEQERHDVWIAIACHTSPHIAERIGELAKLIRLALASEFKNPSEVAQKLEPLRTDFEGKFPRGEINQVLCGAVIEQIKRNPEKAPQVSWPRALYQEYLNEPDWDGVNKAF